MSKEEVYVCPQCNSPALDVPQLVGSRAQCRKCGWKGPVQDLVGVAMDIQGGLGGDSQEELTRQYMTDVRNTIAKDCALPIGRLLVKYGFVDSENIDKKVMAAYLVAVARAVAVTLLETRDKIETEGINAVVN